MVKLILVFILCSVAAQIWTQAAAFRGFFIEHKEENM